MEIIELKKNLIDEIDGLPIVFLEELNSFIKFVKRQNIKDEYFKLYLKNKKIENYLPKEIIVCSVEEVQRRVREAEKDESLTEEEYEKEMELFFKNELGITL